MILYAGANKYDINTPGLQKTVSRETIQCILDSVMLNHSEDFDFSNLINTVKEETKEDIDTELYIAAENIDDEIEQEIILKFLKNNFEY